ncbi:MAG: TOBE domain-containing protein [Deltaproteobacteria bacterium]|nr:TOBE domain-containing protein [Deltaproteobacteria bacterium]
MKLSARNVLKGTVKAIDIGVVNVEVVLEIAPGLEVTSIITKKSCERLGLGVGKEAYVIIKASNVMIGTDS